MRIYIIGPVTGREDNNIAVFSAVRIALSSIGCEVSIPHDIVPNDAEWVDAMRLSINDLTSYVDGKPLYDGVALLSDWYDSRGAMLEASVARAIGLPVMTAGEWIEKGGSL